ncbi:MAG: M16 family metallopeptidase [Solirubrobacteraceae bacterium]
MCPWVQQDVPTVSAPVGNGMRVIELPVGGRLATSISIAFPAGSRHETAGEVGAAHLLEHMAFKGTAGRPTARELNRAAERLGTELGASTGDGHVEFFATVRAESAMEVTDLLADLCGRPLLDPELLEGERAVVLQEIADDDEDPGGRAGERLAAALFPGHRLATPITGKAADIERLGHAALVAFRERQWSPQAGVAILAGNLDHIDRAGLARQLERIPARPGPPTPPPIAAFAPRIEVEQRDSEVVHLRLAYHLPGFDLTSTRGRATAAIYSHVLGGPMGSRLFDEVREQRSMCYAIDGYVWGYASTTFVSVDASLPPSRLVEARELIDAIIDDLRRHGPTDEEAYRARAYGMGAGALSFESIGARAGHALDVVMEFGDDDIDPMSYLRAIEAVGLEDLAAIAGRVVPEPCVGCVGPVDRHVFG